MKIIFLLLFLSFNILSAVYGQKTKKNYKKRHITHVKKAVEKADDYDFIFCGKIESKAEFKGCSKGWETFITEHINQTIPLVNAAPPGTYKVTVWFVVQKDGTVAEATPISNCGYGMETELIRVINLSPKWDAATQNGRYVSYRIVHSFTFVVPAAMVAKPAIKFSVG